jgi:NADH-quinone oxidoreductase subunit F
MISTRPPVGLVCLRGIDQPEPWSLQSYEKLGGYQAWRRILKEKTPRETIIQILKDSGLRGRGGAGFPTGLKWSFMPENKNNEARYVLCNSDEGEPGTCKDREILRLNPHQVIEGMAIAAYVAGASHAYNYLRGEFKEGFDRGEQALKEAYEAGLIGDDCLGSGLSIQIHQVLGAGAYIVGEESAMLESLEGKRGMPRIKPPFPIQKGLYGQPTLINNTESLASVPVILEKGAKWFQSIGVENSAGTKMFCISGHVNRPGVFELPLGTPFTELLELSGGMLHNRTCKAVIPGGSSMYLVPGDLMMQSNMDYDSMAKAGSAIGSGGVIVMDESTCMVEALASIMYFYKHESCGQCTPCREGSKWLYEMIHNIHQGKGSAGDLEQIKNVAKQMEGKTICVFAEAMSWPINSFIDHFYDEFNYFIRHKKSKVRSA